MAVPSSGYRVLVTGGDGFVGRYLVKTLHAKLPIDHEIIVGTLASYALNGNGPVRRIGLDVTDPANVRAVLQKERPTHLFHLAAIAALDAARNDLRQTWAINFSGALNVAIGIMEAAPECRLLFCSSGQIYGASFRSGEPLNESAPLDPIDAYGASKAAADVMVGQMAKRGLRAIRLRPFNHTGVGQGSGFVVPDFAAQIAAIERGEQKPVITVGNLDSRRDLMDVNDVVDAYVRCVLQFDQLAPGSAFNVASGEAISVGQILNTLLSFSPDRIEIRQDINRVRSADIPVVVGDASLARKLLGWKPQVPLAETLRAVLNQYRALGAKA